MADFALRKLVTKSYVETLLRVPEALKTEGFGVLTEIDVKATMKQKLGVEFRPYTILGACNPALAHQVLSSELELGVMLPCNVVVYEGDEGQTVVVAIDPMATIAATATPAIRQVAQEVRTRLGRVLERI